ncbi:hypothetical protein F2Q68_00044210 [Brassica cretica]|uniref:Uncharacterized protein n=2 Tax=Brassica cretica TaxID=69181 RepID=A0A8S9LQE5_BRACR|nr:hypothetical protein F2Q68_00044210 [Brassica cretica]
MFEVDQTVGSKSILSVLKSCPSDAREEAIEEWTSMAASIEPRECIYVSLWSLFSGGWCRAVTAHLSFSLPINVQALSRLGGVSLHSGLPFEGLCGMATYSF